MLIAVIGGGYAGLAAAVTLTRAGIPLTLFEAGRELGGRARGVNYRGTRLDNGQHILLGAYRDTLRLMAMCGVAETALQRQPLALTIPGHFSLTCPTLPAPLHLVAGLLFAQGLPWQERLGAIRFALSLRLRNFRLPVDISVADLLRHHHQHGRIAALLWEPLCLAALNTPIERASAQVFLNVLRDSFSQSRSDSDVVLPRVDLTALFPAAAGDFIRAHGGRVLSGTRVHAIGRNGKNYEIEGEYFSHVICATAPQHATALLASLPELATTVGRLQTLDFQPIATVWVQYPPGIRLDAPMLGLTGGLGQWVFDRGQTHGQAGLLAVVISAEGAYQDWPVEQIAAQVTQELGERFGLPAPLWHKVIVERRATFACTVGVQRPEQAVGLDRFYLAGDYTAGDYPATIEGAVRSGIQAAERILAG